MTRVQILFVLLVSVVGGVFLCNTLFGPFRHMGRVERLNSPVTITGWTERGLQTADGRLVEIPNIRHLPASSLAISEFTKRGIEIDSNGRVIGLVRTWHWCGNDPISAEILRVDLSGALAFLQIGEPVELLPETDFPIAKPGGRFNSEWGWNVSEYGHFRIWQSEKKRAQLSRAIPASPQRTP